MIVTLGQDEYGLRNNNINSRIKITINGYKNSDECDVFYGFSFGNNKYLTFVQDFDGENYDSPAGRKGIFIYPSGDAINELATGDVSTLIPTQEPYFSWAGVRNAVSGDDYNNFGYYSQQNGDEWPVIFEFINNMIDNTLTVKFTSLHIQLWLQLMKILNCLLCQIWEIPPIYR